MTRLFRSRGAISTLSHLFIFSWLRCCLHKIIQSSGNFPEGKKEFPLLYNYQRTIYWVSGAIFENVRLLYTRLQLS